ncbi:MAG: hypothetical protein A3C30_04505 [Candidatus Levybacteria bacterium RIFCSPHIGHO2_02_FULL_40_18]|nr:MAG: hypothetical protein A2869_01595 [Candidatus Levybacteria bacterium RIFCSPHIGHO2_01_FULL_40_58]OGH26341.1 MAG: hypothetical protein A3C30_04505 [Candidatus Levybacteria bacterium RIFCSPHIGHO2_02_FULL_40_18]OGH31301.1 MAG: hypothetical protein A3E43_02760 [Candidatus Levybacteria bacterium RIFCSPHIGHO2_12_FULL_40_31]OGH40803.1 MAG: hypothetical protein A2894_02195 [Candidatus Levybacteria bacterium RIFCSPLOWO2_01_FULL_40_64]HLC76932.1 TasA family protein [archaeon]
MITTTINSKVLISGAVILAAAALIIGATFAFFSDTETSQDNVLAAGALDLKIDSEAHYAGLVCQDNTPDQVDNPIWVDDNPSSTTRPELVEKPCVGTWVLKDLVEGDKFFYIEDLKPGDEGENTISMHVFNNDAWGRIRVFNIVDADVNCTEPESDATDPECNVVPTPLPSPDVDGELSENLDFFLWLDQGNVPGFQCFQTCDDPMEGDNIFNGIETVTQADVIGQDESGITLTLAPALAEAYNEDCLAIGPTPTPAPADGHNNYGICHGLASDGRLVGSATYYIGVAWCLGEATQNGCDGSGVGNEVQTDSVSADIAFDIVQHRNNPTPPVFPTIAP